MNTLAQEPGRVPDVAIRADDAERRQHFKLARSGWQYLRDTVESGFEVSVDPDDKVSGLQEAHVRRAEGEMMHGSLRGDNHIRAGYARHDCSGNFLQWCNRGDHARRSQRGRALQVKQEKQ